MNRLQYYSHTLLHSKIKVFLPLIYLSCIIAFSNFLNLTTLCEADNDNVIKNELAREEAEQRIAAAEQMVNNYRKHESLGTDSYKSGVDLSKVDSNGVNQAAAGVGLVSALTWALKFLRII